MAKKDDDDQKPPLNLRDMLLGAVISTFVTIVSGVALYYFTEAGSKKTEQLSYTVARAGDFSGGQQDVAFTSISVVNSGSVAANKVTIEVASSDAIIRDVSITPRNGLRETLRVQEPKRLEISYDSLVPSDEVTIGLLLSKPEDVAVTVRSNSAVGTELARDAQSDLWDSPFFKWGRRLLALMAFITFATGSGLYLSRHSKALASVRSRRVDEKVPNNVGFLLLHHGLTDEADEVLTAGRKAGHFDPYTLTNSALCKAVLGQWTQADALQSAASFLNEDPDQNRSDQQRVRALILFNSGLMALLKGEHKEAAAKLNEAVALSPESIRHYCQRSILLAGVRTDPGFASICT